jgi:prevent-host-death family protein
MREGKDEGAQQDSSTVSITEASNSLGNLIGRVEFAREEIVITRGKNRRPVAKLVPVKVA